MPADVQVEADDGVMIITVNRLTEDGRALPLERLADRPVPAF